MTNGRESPAAAWIADQRKAGDFSRHCVLDAPMLARERGRPFRAALDVGCGEGRFCRLRRDEGIRATGIDATPSRLAAAQDCDPGGDYRLAKTEALPFVDASFDLAISDLTLVDIEDSTRGIQEMTRVLRPGGALLMAGLNGFNTAGGWMRGDGPVRRVRLDHDMPPRTERLGRRGIPGRNWPRRPFRDDMQPLPASGLLLRHFDKPEPHGGDRAPADRFRHAPHFHIMEWEKPAPRATTGEPR